LRRAPDRDRHVVAGVGVAGLGDRRVQHVGDLAPAGSNRQRSSSARQAGGDPSYPTTRYRFPGRWGGVFGAGADVTGEGHRVTADVRRNLSVVRRHRVAIECLADVPGDVGRIGVVEHRDLVVDVQTPVSPVTADSAAARWRPWSTMPVSVRLPFSAVASTPSGTAMSGASALFAAVVSSGSSRSSRGGSTTSRWLCKLITPATRRAAARSGGRA